MVNSMEVPKVEMNLEEEQEKLTPEQERKYAIYGFQKTLEFAKELAGKGLGTTMDGKEDVNNWKVMGMQAEKFNKANAEIGMILDELFGPDWRSRC